MIDRQNMARPLFEVMKHLPEVLLDEMAVNREAAIAFAIAYQRAWTQNVTIGELSKWRRNVEYVVMLEQMRRKRDWTIKAWPRDFADTKFWNAMRMTAHHTIGLRSETCG